MDCWHGFILSFLALCAALSLVAASDWAFAMRATGLPLTYRSAILVKAVCVASIAWGYVARHNKMRLLDLFMVHLQWVFQGLVIVIGFAYMNLRVGSLISQQMHSHAAWVIKLLSLLDVTGVVTYTIQCLPSHATCLHLLIHPFAILLMTCVLSYYCALANLWAELNFPLPDPKTTPTTTASTAVASGHQTQSALQELSAYNAASRGRSSSLTPSPSSSSTTYTYTVADSFVAPSPSSITTSAGSVTKAVLYTAVAVSNKIVSNEPIFKPAPIIKSVSVNARNLSSEPILSGRTSEVALLTQAESTVMPTQNQDKQAEVINNEAAATHDGEVSIQKESVAVETSNSEPKHHAVADKSPLLDHTTTKSAIVDSKIQSKSAAVAVENRSSESIYHAEAGKSDPHNPADTVTIEAQAGGGERIPAVPARMRRSSSLKAAWDKVLVPVKATKKSLAAASFIRKKSIQRTTSSSAETTAADPAPSPAPGRPGRTSSLKKTMSGLQSKLSPANCFGKGTVQT